MCRSELGADSKKTTTTQVAVVCGKLLNITVAYAPCASNDIFSGRKKQVWAEHRFDLRESVWMKERTHYVPYGMKINSYCYYLFSNIYF